MTRCWTARLQDTRVKSDFSVDARLVSRMAVQSPLECHRSTGRPVDSSSAAQNLILAAGTFRRRPNKTIASIMQIQACPNCGINIVPTADGDCPSCRKAFPGQWAPDSTALAPHGRVSEHYRSPVTPAPPPPVLETNRESPFLRLTKLLALLPFSLAMVQLGATPIMLTWSGRDGLGHRIYNVSGPFIGLSILIGFVFCVISLVGGLRHDNGKIIAYSIAGLLLNGGPIALVAIIALAAK